MKTRDLYSLVFIVHIMAKTGRFTFLYNCQLQLGKILDLQNIILYTRLLKDHAKNTMAFQENDSSPGKTREIGTDIVSLSVEIGNRE